MKPMPDFGDISEDQMPEEIAEQVEQAYEDYAREDGRVAYELRAVIYLREDEVEEFEDALEDIICPGEEINGEHECRLGVWTIKRCEDDDE